MPELIEVRFKGNRKDYYTWDSESAVSVGGDVLVDEAVGGAGRVHHEHAQHRARDAGNAVVRAELERLFSAIATRAPL